MDAISRSLYRQRLVAFALAWCPILITTAFGSEGGGSKNLQFRGPAFAVDGDTLDVAGSRVRLEGVDAPEIGQMCNGGSGGTWACGKDARRALEMLANSGEVACENKGLDKYGRHLGVCFAGGKDLNAEMVRMGLAWAFVKYSATYVAEEAEAKAAQRGIWKNETEPAWIYREKRWANAEQAAPSGCAIKGNVSDKGQIFHLPWSPWYDKVRVEVEKGERWFCSEAEALSAGWRPAIVN
jgi:endonuclease YncB( thermonuclease family)